MLSFWPGLDSSRQWDLVLGRGVSSQIGCKAGAELSLYPPPPPSSLKLKFRVCPKEAWTMTAASGVWDQPGLTARGPGSHSSRPPLQIQHLPQLPRESCEKLNWRQGVVVGGRFPAPLRTVRREQTVEVSRTQCPHPRPGREQCAQGPSPAPHLCCTG